MPAVKVLFFAAARDLVGKSEASAEITAEDLATIKSEIMRQFVELEQLKSPYTLAVNDEYVEGAIKIKEGDVVAVIPPLSGG